MNPKFKVGDTAYYNNVSYLILVHHLYNNYILYTAKKPVNGSYKVALYEFDLLSVTEWENKQKGNQNHAGRFAHENSVGYKVKNNNRCVCGAHTIKDARHSLWCDIKN